jgi:hypothetical protein
VVLPEKEKVEKRESSLKPTPRPDTQEKRWVIKLDFVGKRRKVKPEGVERSEAVVSYFKGHEDQ